MYAYDYQKIAVGDECCTMTKLKHYSHGSDNNVKKNSNAEKALEKHHKCICPYD